MCRERANPMPELDNRELYFGLERDPSLLSKQACVGTWGANSKGKPHCSSLNGLYICWVHSTPNYCPSMELINIFPMFILFTCRHWWVQQYSTVWTKLHQHNWLIQLFLQQWLQPCQWPTQLLGCVIPRAHTSLSQLLHSLISVTV